MPRTDGDKTNPNDKLRHGLAPCDLCPQVRKLGQANKEQFLLGVVIQNCSPVRKVYSKPVQFVARGPHMAQKRRVSGRCLRLRPN